MLKISSATGCRAYCSVPNCRRRGGGMHRFPKDENARLMWKFLCRVSRVVSDTMFVCRCHFRKDDVFRTGKGLFRLRQGALPCLKLPRSIPDRVIKGRREKMKCAVQGCGLGAQDLVSLHFFPRSSSRRDEWKKVCQVESAVARNTVLCSQHFLPSDFKTRCDRKILLCSAMPSRHLPRPCLSTNQSDCDDVPTILAQESPLSLLEEKVCKSHSEIWASFIDYPGFIQSFGQSENQLRATNVHQKFGGFNETDLVQSLSNLLNTAKENFLQPLILPSRVTVLTFLCNDSQWKGMFGVTKPIVMYLTDLVLEVSECVPEGALTLMERIALSLCKVHINVPFDSLGLLFGVEEHLSIVYFRKTIVLLASVLKCTVGWPLKSEVKICKSQCFQNLSDARVLLERIVLSISPPTDCHSCLAHLNSEFAGKLSIKLFVGYDQLGIITFISKLYSINMPDDCIFEDSFRDRNLLEPFVDAVIVERDIKVNRSSKAMNVKIYYHQGRESASCHKSLKSFKIFEDLLSWPLVCHLVDIVTVVAGVLNLSSCSGMCS